MSRPSTPAALLLAALPALAVACAGRTPTPAAAAPAPVAAAPATFAWPGTYVLTGHGFEEGDREAVFTITRRDTAHAITVAVGPPGEVISFRVAGDSAHVLWALAPGTQFMAVDLRGRGDSVTGRWAVGTVEGSITGYRRR